MIENAAAMVQSIAAAYINRSQFVGYIYCFMCYNFLENFCANSVC